MRRAAKGQAPEDRSPAQVTFVQSQHPASAADEFAREFAEDVWVPDAARATELWERKGETWRSGTRWCRGCEVSSRLNRDAQARIELQGFVDFGARAALAGRRLFAPPIF
jgi:hypothetical protein